MMNKNQCVNVLHVEDDLQQVCNYLCEIYPDIDFDTYEIDKQKIDGKALEIHPGYWWAKSLQEAVLAIDKMTAAGRMFDFVLIDRRLSDAEQISPEKVKCANQVENDTNKCFLQKQFPWYAQETYRFTGDFIFLYLTIINRSYLRNIYFVTGQDCKIQSSHSDIGLIRIWYSISGNEISENEGNKNYPKFREWCKIHYIQKASGDEYAHDQLIECISLPHAGICHQFHEALDIFKYVNVHSNKPVIDFKYCKIVTELLLASKQYDGTMVEGKALADLREGVHTLVQIIAERLLKIDCSTKEARKNSECFDDNDNVKPYKVRDKLFRKPNGIFAAERLGYLIALAHHVQSEEVHGGNTDISKVLANTYTMHTVVFAFMEICRYIVVQILCKDHQNYRKQ